MRNVISPFRIGNYWMLMLKTHKYSTARSILTRVQFLFLLKHLLYGCGPPEIPVRMNAFIFMCKIQVERWWTWCLLLSSLLNIVLFCDSNCHTHSLFYWQHIIYGILEQNGRRKLNFKLETVYINIKLASVTKQPRMYFILRWKSEGSIPGEKPLTLCSSSIHHP